MKYRVAMLLCVLAGPVAAGNSPLSPTLYYEMGGGTSFTRPLNDTSTSPALRVSGTLNLPLNCGIWDQKILEVEGYPKLIKDYLDGTLDQVGQAIVAQLQAIGQGLAVAALQRALPGMYDYSQTLTAQINGRVDVAKRSCEVVVNDVNNGVNPLDAWKKIGLGVGWRSSLQPLDTNGGPTTGDEPTSILAAEKDIAANATSDPIPWFGPELAGDSVNPIFVVRDLVTAGYNIFESDTGAEDLVTETSAAGANTTVLTIRGTEQLPKRLGVLFADTATAVEWANRFIGEQQIYTCEGEPGCDSLFTPGIGLAVLAREEVETLTTAWTALIGTEVLPTIEQLTTVSSNEVQVTSFVYDALLRFPEQDQNVYIGRLIDDVALARAVEKALALRRMILVSSESPVVKGYVQAGVVSKQITDRIVDEVNDLMWSVQTQNKLASGVAKNILAYDALRDTVGASTLTGTTSIGRSSTLSDRPVAPAGN